jgi:uncharacterized protein (TIGR03089 family)
VTTFPDLLERIQREQPGRPLVTFYDHASGERTELSVATYANWVAKAASLLIEECDLARGDRMAVALPTHWLGPVMLGAAWTAGIEVVWSRPAEAAVCGPVALEAWSDLAHELPVLASALLPLGTRFPDGVPAGVHDLGIEIWSQPDAFVPWDPPQPDDRAVTGLTQRELWSGATEGGQVAPSARLLTTLNPAGPDGVAALARVLATGGSVVLVAHADPERLAETYAAERATQQLAEPGQPTLS